MTKLATAYDFAAPLATGHAPGLKSGPTTSTATGNRAV